MTKPNWGFHVGSWNIGATAAANESIEDIKSELCKIREMIRNVRTEEVSTEFNVVWSLMNAVNNESYDLIKYQLEKMKNLTLADTVERMKAVEMKLKDTDVPASESAHKGHENGICKTVLSNKKMHRWQN